MRPITDAPLRSCAVSTGSWRNIMGDGVLVYFGYPQAHEDDAERAVRAGLELIAAVANSRRMRRCKPVLALPPGWLWLAT